MTHAITIRFTRTEAAAILALIEDYPALSAHKAGRVAMRLGLKVLECQPEALDYELVQINREAEDRRLARRQGGQS